MTAMTKYRINRQKPRPYFQKGDSRVVPEQESESITETHRNMYLKPKPRTQCRAITPAEEDSDVMCSVPSITALLVGVEVDVAIVRPGLLTKRMHLLSNRQSIDESSVLDPYPLADAGMATGFLTRSTARCALEHEHFQRHRW